MSLPLNREDQKLLKIILNFSQSRKKKLYIVGGYLRDIILKRERANPDIDFCLKGQAINFGRGLAKRLKAGFVVLDKEHGACRLVKADKNKTYTLDFTDFRGETLEEDLLHRDFTINALALELDKAFLSADNFLLDPYSARKDLKAKIIRVVNAKAFDEDPLRILRAFSFSSIFGFKIDKETLRLIRLKKNKLAVPSSERIRDELFKILESPCAFEYILQLDKLKILEIVLPEIKMMRNVDQGPYHHLDVWQHSLETVRQFEIAVQELKNHPDIRDYLNEVISAERRRFALVKLGCLLHDIGKPKALRREDGKLIFHGHERIGREITEDIVKRLKLSNDEMDSLNKMVLWHLRPGYLADNEMVTARAAFRFFRDTTDEAVSTLLISLADQRATKGRLTTKVSRLRHEKVVSSLIRQYFKKKKEKKPARLVNGDDLIKEFKLEPSPLIGKILREVEELQAVGRIGTKEEAFKVAKRFIK